MSAGEPTAAGGPGEIAVLVDKTLTYRIVRFSVWLWLRVVHRLRVVDIDHLPQHGGAVIACNHQSFLDIPILAAATRRHVCFVARASLARSRPLGWLMRQCGAVLIERASADRRALREMSAHLERGDLLAVFPEGTRSRDGTLGEFKAGAVVTARRAGVPIVPAAIRGAIDALPRDARLPRPARIQVAFGPAIDPAAPDAEARLRAAVSHLLE